MRPGFQFSMTRAILATTFIAAGLAIIPVAEPLRLDDIPHALVEPIRVIISVWLFSMPMAGFGILIGWPRLYFALGVAAGIMVYLSFA
jgi:hypothetical protein